MKTLKYLFAFMLPLFAMATISSCSEDEASYSPASVPAGAQVYFHSSNAAVVDLEAAEGTFELLVARIDTTNSVSVPVTLKCDSLDGYFTLVNENVEFAAGEAQATVTVSYDGAAVLDTLGYANYVDVVVAVVDEANSTAYGITEMTISVNIPEPWSDWAPVNKEGTGTYTYTNFFSGVDPERPVYYREFLLNDVDAQFRVEGVYYGVDLIIDYDRKTGNCQVKPQYVGYDNSSGSIYVTDMPHFMDGLTYDKYPCTYDKETGTFSLTTIYSTMENIEGNTGSYWGSYGPEIIQLDGFYVPDTSVGLEYLGVFTNAAGESSAVVSVDLGVDADSCRVAMFDSYSEENLAALLAGEVEYTVLKASNYVSFPVEASGSKTAIAITYVGEEPTEANKLTFKVVLGEITADEITGAPIENYEGEWSVTATWKGEVSSYVGNIQQVEIDGDVYLLGTGFSGPVGAGIGYDDSFLMLYDAETGLITMPAQNCADLEYDGNTYNTILGLCDSESGQIYGSGALVGGFNKDGKIVFTNHPDNSVQYDSWMFYAIDFSVISDFIGLELAPATEASEAPAKALKLRGFNGGLTFVKKPIVVEADENAKSF